MRWWTKCCRCCCWLTQKNDTDEDGSALVSNDTTFYVPRRHSSFHTGGAFREDCVNRDSNLPSGSSTDDEENEGRPRCHSTTPADHETQSKFPGNVKLESLQVDSRNSICSSVLEDISETESPHTVTSEDSEVCGYIIFSTEYEERDQKLRVLVERASNLPRKGDMERYSTMVKLGLTCTTYKASFSLSRAAKDSVYKEEHFLPTNRDKWKTSKGTMALRLSVFDIDRQGRHDAIGHALLPASDFGQGPTKHGLPLTPRSTLAYTTGVGLGQILLGLFYSPSNSRLAVHVVRARHLLSPLKLCKESCDTFCKVTLMCAGEKVKTTRSRPGPESSFDHRSSFVMPSQFLRDSSVLVTVLARGTLGRARPLGRVSAGPYTESAEGVPTQWGRMLQQDTRSITMWRNLHL